MASQALDANVMPAPDDFPVHLDIDLSSKCNLRCTFCHLSYFDPVDSTQISASQFSDWLGPYLDRIEKLTLFSKYEPLTCKDFLPIFEQICRHNLETYFSTNALLLTPDIAKALVGRLTFLTVSVTGFDQASYQKHMGSDGLLKVQENLAYLCALKAQRQTPYPQLRLSTVAMSDTVQNLCQAVDFAKRFEMSEGIQVTSLIAYDDIFAGKIPVRNSDSFNQSARLALAYAKEMGVRLVLQSGSLDDNERDTVELGHRACLIPWHRLSIQPNGDVYPCPVSSVRLGNLNSRTLEEIWNGPELRTFRLGVNDIERMNPDCKDCAHCRTKSVTRLEVNDRSKADNCYAGMKRKPAATRPVKEAP